MVTSTSPNILATFNNVKLSICSTYFFNLLEIALYCPTNSVQLLPPSAILFLPDLYKEVKELEKTNVGCVARCTVVNGTCVEYRVGKVL